ncbi:phytanoyl-CoA dioxygenase family protein [Sphingorhabdus sp.]|uniref:phytanoyl-CoA dioxygenase family protein n=2 Tax=Sphingorhabdus sp. TaxID=1902408 RepID=UPI003BAF5962|nr:phytanoyl-CoA dioxygenase family protein [Sphingomonadales bacterium]MBK9431246.1 phytanoyl-CoA dioxygenase family protein [Sphingomonadales bacterium]
MDFVRHYREHGYAIVRRLVSRAELARLGDAADAVHREGLNHGKSFRHGNLHYRLEAGEVRMVQWPSYHNDVLADFRIDQRILQLLEPLIGCDLKQIINQVHWKKPGGRGNFAYHQDSRFRKPDHAYRNLGEAYVQTGLAIDPHDPLSGGMKILPGSHLRGSVDIDKLGVEMGDAPQEALLEAAGFDPAGLIDVELEPGDFALWSPYLIHGSGTNNADHFRRFYINGYVRAEDCDRGEWAFREGEPVPLGGKPALVHYEQLFERPEPHYL